MSEGRKEALQRSYDELAEELHMLHRSLRSNGFTTDEAIDIMLGLIHSDGRAYLERRERAARKASKGDIVREWYANRQREKEILNDSNS